MPLLVDGRAIWREFRDIDTAEGAFPYESCVADEIAATPGIGADQDPFEAIARQALAAGIGTGWVGAAKSALFPARALHQFAEGMARGAVRRWSQGERWLSASIGTPSAIGFAASGCVLSDASQGLGRGRVGREEAPRSPVRTK